MQALRAQAEQLDAQADRHAQLTGWAASAAEFCQRVQGGLAQADFAQRRQLLELLVDRVVVTEDEVEIRYVIPLSPEGERRRFCHLRKDYLDGFAPAVEIRIEGTWAAFAHVAALARWDNGPDAASAQIREHRSSAVGLVAGEMLGAGARGPFGPGRRTVSNVPSKAFTS